MSDHGSDRTTRQLTTMIWNAIFGPGSTDEKSTKTEETRRPPKPSIPPGDEEPTADGTETDGNVERAADDAATDGREAADSPSEKAVEWNAGAAAAGEPTTEGETADAGDDASAMPDRETRSRMTSDTTSKVAAEAEQGSGPAAASATTSATGNGQTEVSSASVVVGEHGASAASDVGVVAVGPDGAAAANEAGVVAVGPEGGASASEAANASDVRMKDADVEHRSRDQDDGEDADDDSA